MAIAIQATNSGEIGGYSGFGTRQEEELYDQITFNVMRLLSVRTTKTLKEMQEGNYNPYTRE